MDGRAFRPFHGGVAREPLIPAGAPLDFIPKQAARTA
jgi:hypothetical protein